MPWYLQQINAGSGPLVPNESVGRMVSAQMPAWFDQALYPQTAICAR
jgi:hypothetical protein